MDTTRLRMGEVIAAVSAFVLFVVLFFFKWYGVSVSSAFKKVTGVTIPNVNLPGVSSSANGWHSLTILRWLILLTIIVAVGMAILTMTQRSVALPVSASVIVTGLGALTAILILYRIINQPGPNDLVTVKVGAWLGFLSAAGVAFGGFQAMREEGTSFSQAAEQIQGGRRPAPGAAPAAPPPPPAPEGEAPASGSAPPPSAPPPGSGPPAPTG
jgi:hypothetical protein